MFHYSHCKGKKTEAWKFRNFCNFTQLVKELESLITELRPLVATPDWCHIHSHVLVFWMHRSTIAVQSVSTPVVFPFRIAHVLAGRVMVDPRLWNKDTPWERLLEWMVRHHGNRCWQESGYCRPSAQGPIRNSVPGSRRPWWCISSTFPSAFAKPRDPHLLNAKESRGYIGLHCQPRRSLESLNCFNVLISQARFLCSLWTSCFMPLLQW